MTRRKRTRPSLRAILSASVAALVPAAAAQAACTTSPDGLTRTCTGAITTAQSFDHLSATTVKSFGFVFEGLTSTAMTSTGFQTIDFMTNAMPGSSYHPGVAGSAQSLRFNLDATTGPFTLETLYESFANPTVVMTSEGGGGGSPGEKSGSGTITGDSGGGGGAGGALSLSLARTVVRGPLQTIVAASVGGDGGHGAEGRSTGFGDGHGGAGASGGAGGTVVADFDAVDFSATLGGPGVWAVEIASEGGDGGDGGTGKAADYTGSGGIGNIGGAGGTVSVNLTGGSSTTAINGASGILLSSTGGTGGVGGTGDNTLTGAARGGAGGKGGAGGNVTLASTDDSSVTITAAGQGGLVLQSLAGNGGSGGHAVSGGDAYGGDGGQGGTGGSVTLSLPENAVAITTAGAAAQGIFARSYGGAGGDGGSANGIFGPAHGGAAAGSGPGGDVSLTFNGSVTTGGDQANAVLAHSVGGFAGEAGAASGFVAYGAGSESAGAGGGVTIEWAYETGDGTSTLATTGDDADGVFAQSQGGGGGKGSSGSGIAALSGSGSAGGDGGEVRVHTLGAAITTEGARSRAVFAQSAGGGGGDGGGARGIVSVGGAGSGGGAGGEVIVRNHAVLTTAGDDAEGIFAQSVGGGGGAASSTSGISAIGGKGGSGAAGGSVTVTNFNDITTAGDNADAILAQSVGGGGGKGGNAFATGVGFSQAIGGDGGTGGHGGDVTINDFQASGPPTISTSGDSSRGVVAQSVGGGGGHGGNAISVSGGLEIDFALALGGSGGAAGDGGAVASYFNGGVVTEGDHAVGLMATSTGGGGGSAGTTVAVANSVGAFALAVDVGVGGDGGGGGDGGDVLVCRGVYAASAGDCAAGDTADGLGITTSGEAAHGVLAASGGGGGGHSGVTVSGSAISSMAANVAVGGDGGGGGAGGDVAVYSSGGIATSGQAAAGILAMSTGGSGGAAYLTGAASTFGLNDANISVGGHGGVGGGAGDVSVTSIDTITTTGSSSDAIAAFSAAGSGGAGGAVLSATGLTGGNIGIAVGGAGGSGGNAAGNVLVDWSGDSISTSGAQSLGIYAASTGGSGGRGGFDVNGAAASFASVQVTVGGAGGNGGTAGTVSVTTAEGGITTSGAQSPAISAMSLGGTGGRGGASISSTVVSQGDVAVTLGGAGGAGGAADAVTVANAGEIETRVTQSAGIFALSQGGSGGAGGFVAEGGITVGAFDGVPAGSVAVSVGGTGGDGGSAGTVDVTNTGSITTDDYSSLGISAQSIGGHGGTGGAVYSGEANVSTGETLTVTIDVGGSGGTGATADDVAVTNAGAITTLGSDSAAVLAQSVGGNGGKGGSSYNVLANIFAQTGLLSVATPVSVGGSGGSGAIAGGVTVDNTGTISTAGLGSAGVYAQSVGGGGGAGGSGGNILINASKSTQGTEALNVKATVDFAIGGRGGAGGDAGSIQVTNGSAGAIATSGATSAGIFAQAVGGGGGDGGAASGYALAVTGVCSIVGAKSFMTQCKQSNGTSTTVSLGFNASMGGDGGAAGDGGAVTVTNDGTIGTAEETSPGIFAQSVGGGGGSGGSGSAGIGTFTSNAIAGDIAKVASAATKAGTFSLATFTNWSMSIGGAGGASGDGKAVSVANSGSIATLGDDSSGIFAQSVGGGGGAGGGATSSPIHSLSIGGSGKAGGDGGDVTVTGADGSSVETTGNGAFGILAQSIGGGGGDGGHRALLPVTPTLAISVGGSSGANGNGGSVEIENSGTTIRTGAADAVGIFAQSIGGGGGTGGNGLDGADGAVNVGGTGNSRGDGGDVTVTHDGSIATGGSETGVDAAAHGIVAQSVGGGGGYAGSVIMGASSNFGIGLAMNESSDTSGDGGDVSVSATGDITTSGGASVGIFAQSVGGGGGVAGTANPALLAPVKIGNGGGTGTPGVVSVSYGGDAGATLTTTGPGAHGIFAQSAGGPGTSTSTGTKVSVDVSADISVTGAGAHGIFAQSVGDGMGVIEVTVYEGATVEGGAATADSDVEDGAGVFVKDGTRSTITNAGTITSVLGSAGVAINASGTDLTLDNSGTVTGEILKASSVRVLNRATGLIDAGPLLDVDRLTNRGTLAVGLGAIGATRLTGDLTQNSGGLLAFELDPSRPEAGDRADQLEVGGSATLDGRVAIRVLDPWQPVAGRQSVPLLTAGALSADGLEVIPSAVAQHRLERPAAGAIGLSYDIHFANPGILAAANANQDGVARHLHGVYRARALDDDIALTLIGIERAADYAVVMNTLGAEVAVDNQIASLLSTIRFGDALLSCAERTGAYRFLDEGRCGWLGIGGQRFERDATGDNLGFDVDSWQIAGGGQFALDNGWHIGGALSYEHRDLSVRDSRASSDGDQFLAGVSAKRRFGATELSGSFALGYGDFDIPRDPLPGVSLAGTQRMWLVSGQLRAAHLIERGRWTLVPHIDLGVDYLSMDGFREFGDGGLGLRVDAVDDTYVHLQPAIDIGAEFETAAGILIRPRLTLGVTQFIGDAAPSVTSRFAAAPGDVGPFTASTELDRTRLDLAAGLDIFARNNVVVRAEASASLSENSEGYAGALRIEIPF